MDIEKLKETIKKIKTLKEEEKKRLLEKKAENKLLKKQEKLLLLKNKINLIKEVFINNWKKDRLPYIQKFADTIKQGIPTPALSVCGRGTREIRFTQYLTYFLDPVNNHGLGSKLLKLLFQEEANQGNLPKDWYNNCSVEAEIWIGGNCTCDIVITGESFAFLIEQKIHASESFSPGTGRTQLQRYSLALKENPAYNKLSLFKIFLTTTGRLPQKVKDWLPWSHRDIIYKAMTLLKDPSLTSIAKGNLQRFLIDLTMGPYEKLEDNINMMKNLADELINGGFQLSKFIQFSRMAEEHKLLLKLLLEE